MNPKIEVKKSSEEINHLVVAKYYVNAQYNLTGA